MKFQITNFIAVDPSAPKAQICSVIISKDATELQSLYIVYTKEPKGSSFIKVFNQKTLGDFKEMTESDLNNLEMHSSIQPFFLDINGDMK